MIRIRSDGTVQMRQRNLNVNLDSSPTEILQGNGREDKRRTHNESTTLRKAKNAISDVGTGQVHNQKRTKKRLCAVTKESTTNNSYPQDGTQSDALKRRHKCDICFKSCASNFALKEHYRIHTGERPFECDICSASFARKYMLQDHVAAHVGEFRFKCGTCSKSFRRKYKLTDHIATHTGKQV